MTEYQLLNQIPTFKPTTNLECDVVVMFTNRSKERVLIRHSGHTEPVVLFYLLYCGLRVFYTTRAVVVDYWHGVSFSTK